MNTCTVKQAEGIPGTRIRTLVVDDSLFMLKILAQLLEADDGFELVGTATDGRKALRYVSVLSPDLVLDLHMPGLNGIQATRYIKDMSTLPPSSSSPRMTVPSRKQRLTTRGPMHSSARTATSGIN